VAVVSANTVANMTVAIMTVAIVTVTVTVVAVAAVFALAAVLAAPIATAAVLASAVLAAAVLAAVALAAAVLVAAVPASTVATATVATTTVLSGALRCRVRRISECQRATAGSDEYTARDHRPTDRRDAISRPVHVLPVSFCAVSTRRRLAGSGWRLDFAQLAASPGRCYRNIVAYPQVTVLLLGGRDRVGQTIAGRHRDSRRDDREAPGMGLFRKRKSRATRRAEAKALKAAAKLEARLGAKNEKRRIASVARAEANAVKAQLKARRDSDKAAVKVAEVQLKAVREGKLLSPARIRRTLTVFRLLAPVLVPVLYRAATAVRGILDERRADQLGVSLSQVGKFSGHGGQLSARIAGAERSLQGVAEKNPKDAETKQFVAAMRGRLMDLAAAVTAAESMPASRRRAAHTAIADQLDGIDADLLARLGVL
jgi:hypothetical protein